MSLTHINNIKRSDLDKHIHIKAFLLYKVIPKKDVVSYILNMGIKEDKYWVDLADKSGKQNYKYPAGIIIK